MKKRHTGFVAPLALTLAAAMVARSCPGQMSSGDRAAVVALSAAHIANALYGARLAIRDSLHESPFGMRSNRSVRSEFLFGTGTALSPGLPFLIAQAGVTALAAGPRGTARVASTSLAVAGGLYVVGQLGEPEAWRTLRHIRSAPRTRVAVVIGNLLLPAALSVAAVRARD
jgi:hypothetical protein